MPNFFSYKIHAYLWRVVLQSENYIGIFRKKSVHRAFLNLHDYYLLVVGSFTSQNRWFETSLVNAWNYLRRTLDPIADVEDDGNEIRLNFLAGLQIIEKFLHK